MMKRISALLLALVMMVTVPAALADTVSGTGTAKGFGGDVTVTITLTDGVITEVVAQGEGETSGIGSKAIDNLPAVWVEKNSIFDIASSATITSTAMQEAAAAALTAAGVNPDDYMAEGEAAKAEDAVYEADVVIVGAGGAGMTAALTAAQAGKTVIVVESQPMVGGNSVKATGGMNAAKTPAQDENEFGESAGVEKQLKAAESYADNEAIADLAAKVTVQWNDYQANPAGYFDSVELMELDTMIGGKGVNDPALVATMVEGTANAIEWLKTVDINLTSVASFGGASVKRIHRPLNDEGKVVSVGTYMVPRLEAACADKAASPS